MINAENPLIVQSDRTLLLDVHAPRAEECRNALIPFAELIRSPEHLHTYQISPLSLWNAASAGFTGAQALETLKEFSRYEIPQAVGVWISETAEKFGKLRLVEAPKEKNENGQDEEFLYLVSTSPFVFKQIEANPYARKQLVPCDYVAPENASVELTEDEKKFCFRLLLVDRGTVKQNLLKLGWPVLLLTEILLKLTLGKQPLQESLLKSADIRKKVPRLSLGTRGLEQDLEPSFFLAVRARQLSA